MGDMGDDIGKYLAFGCLICMVFICAVGGGEYYLAKVFLFHHATFDSALVFTFVSAFFIGSMWRFYKWSTELL